MHRSTAAAKATYAAASSVQLTCCTLTSTVGLLHLPSPSTRADITNPLYTQYGHSPYPKSPLLFGLHTGEFGFTGAPPRLLDPEFDPRSRTNFPPLFKLKVDSARTMPPALIPPLLSGMSSNRYPSPSAPPRSLQASRRPQGCQVPSPGRRMSQHPGLERLTRSEPGEATKGVTIDAAATGDPDRSWTVMDQPLRSFPGRSRSLPKEFSQLLELLWSGGKDLNKRG